MINIFLIDPHPIVRYGITQLLKTQASFKIIGEASDLKNSLSAIEGIKASLIISEINDILEIELIKKIKKASKVKILILSNNLNVSDINYCLEAGANGFLGKDCTKPELIDAIERVMKGEIYTGLSVSKVLVNNYLNKSLHLKANQIKLSRREHQIIELISYGLSNKEIADKLMLSINTVDAHRYNILKKFEVKKTAEMLVKSVRMKVIGLNGEVS